MASSLVQGWWEHLGSTQNQDHWFRDYLLEPCPELADWQRHSGLSPRAIPERLVDQAHAVFLRRIREAAAEAVPGFEMCDSGLGMHTSLLGSQGDRNVCLIIGAVGEALDRLPEAWSVRWELAALAAMTRRHNFALILVGADSQTKPLYIEGSIEPWIQSIDLLLNPSPVACHSCTTCPIEEDCPEAGRKPKHPLGSPPNFVRSNPRPSGRSMLRPPMNLLGRITSHLARTQESEPGYSPSLISKELEEGDPCMRVLYYAGLGVTKERNESLVWVFEMGHAWHEVIQALALSVDPTIEVELAVKTGNLRGRLDLRKGPLIIDLKTVSQQGGTPKGYVTQVHCYALASRDSGHPVEKLALVSLLKGVGTAQTQEFPLDPSVLNRVEKAVYEADRMVEKKKEPDRYPEASTRSWRCRDCAYTKHCWNKP